MKRAWVPLEPLRHPLAPQSRQGCSLRAPGGRGSQSLPVPLGFRARHAPRETQALSIHSSPRARGGWGGAVSEKIGSLFYD